MCFVGSTMEKKKNSLPLWQLSNSWNYTQRTFKNKTDYEFNEKTDFHCSKSSFYCTCIYNCTWETEYCSRCYFSFPDGQIPEASSRSGHLTHNLPPLPPNHNVKEKEGCSYKHADNKSLFHRDSTPSYICEFMWSSTVQVFYFFHERHFNIRFVDVKDDTYVPFIFINAHNDIINR